MIREIALAEVVLILATWTWINARTRPEVPREVYVAGTVGLLLPVSLILGLLTNIVTEPAVTPGAYVAAAVLAPVVAVNLVLAVRVASTRHRGPR